MEKGNIFDKRSEEERWFLQAKYITYYVLGVLEVLLAFRLVFKLLGASTGSGFVSFLYSITMVFVWPFTGIFNAVVSRGDSMQYILEPGTIIAMVVYAIIARGLVSLFKLRTVNETK